ncbi:acyl-CoA dehydrogenase [Citricoccus sp. NPDC079358]|uniref:acyl-CoA dehydrogenase n=1 Tax=Citricoccus sp. NPDC079358 TaxID=3154653 RepID=UPI00344D8098
MQQNRDADVPPTAASTWDDHETNPGGEVVFTPGALNLTPGDSVYAPVALKTGEGSIAGSLALQPPVEATGVATDAGLWGALTYSVKATETPTACNAATWDAFGTEVIPAGTGFETGVTPAQQQLAADEANIQYYCFEVTLPADAPGVDGLQGQTAAPAWQFIATSVDAETATP